MPRKKNSSHKNKSKGRAARFRKERAAQLRAAAEAQSHAAPVAVAENELYAAPAADYTPHPVIEHLMKGDLPGVVGVYADQPKICSARELEAAIKAHCKHHKFTHPGRILKSPDGLNDPNFIRLLANTAIMFGMGTFPPEFFFDEESIKLLVEEVLQKKRHTQTTTKAADQFKKMQAKLKEIRKRHDTPETAEYQLYELPSNEYLAMIAAIAKAIQQLQQAENPSINVPMPEIIDVGAGDGLTTVLLKQQGFNAVAIDPSDKLSHANPPFPGLVAKKSLADIVHELSNTPQAERPARLYLLSWPRQQMFPELKQLLQQLNGSNSMVLIFGDTNGSCFHAAWRDEIPDPWDTTRTKVRSLPAQIYRYELYKHSKPTLISPTGMLKKDDLDNIFPDDYRSGMSAPRGHNFLHKPYTHQNILMPALYENFLTGTHPYIDIDSFLQAKITRAQLLDLMHAFTEMSCQIPMEEWPNLSRVNWANLSHKFKARLKETDRLFKYSPHQKLSIEEYFALCQRMLELKPAFEADALAVFELAQAKLQHSIQKLTEIEALSRLPFFVDIQRREEEVFANPDKLSEGNKKIIAHIACNFFPKDIKLAKLPENTAQWQEVITNACTLEKKLSELCCLCIPGVSSRSQHSDTTAAHKGKFLLQPEIESIKGNLKLLNDWYRDLYNRMGTAGMKDCLPQGKNAPGGGYEESFSDCEKICHQIMQGAINYCTTHSDYCKKQLPGSMLTHLPVMPAQPAEGVSGTYIESLLEWESQVFTTIGRACDHMEQYLSKFSQEDQQSINDQLPLLPDSDLHVKINRYDNIEAHLKRLKISYNPYNHTPAESGGAAQAAAPFSAGFFGGASPNAFDPDIPCNKNQLTLGLGLG